MTPMKISSVKIVDAAFAVGNHARHEPWNNKRTFQAVGRTTAGAGAVEVRVHASNDGINFIEIGTITLVLSTSEATDGFASDAPWRYIRGRVESISGTGATVDLHMGA
jgi:hypothetical protein